MYASEYHFVINVQFINPELLRFSYFYLSPFSYVGTWKFLPKSRPLFPVCHVISVPQCFLQWLQSTLLAIYNYQHVFVSVFCLHEGSLSDVYQYC